MTSNEEKKKNLTESLANFYKNKTGQNFETDQPLNFSNPLSTDLNEPTVQVPSKIDFKAPEDFQSKLSQETDPDLIVGYEIVDLPSKGIFYKNNLDKVKIEYLTSKDEDILTTPSLIQDGTVIDVVLKKKIKTPDIEPKDLLTGDKNALILFLRASSYGHEYEVEVTDPRNKNRFKQIVDLTKLDYKKPTENPDNNGEFFLEIPMRKKRVKFRLLTSGEEDTLFKRAESIKEAYNKEYSEYSTMKLKAHVTEIDGNRDHSYIQRFIDAMPVRDAIAIRRKIIDVTPDINMEYEFKANDGFKFKAKLTVGVDFFFPNF